jgi:hypothetical protein
MEHQHYTITLAEWELALLADDLRYVARTVFTGADEAWDCEFLLCIYDRLLAAAGYERTDDGGWRRRLANSAAIVRQPNDLATGV